MGDLLQSRYVISLSCHQFLIQPLPTVGEHVVFSMTDAAGAKSVSGEVQFGWSGE